MTTTTPMTIVLQIHPFCNCEGHIKQMKKTLREFGDVKLLAMNPEKGEFTILTAKHPEVIKFALKQTFPKKDIILALQHPNYLAAFNNTPYNLTTRQNPVSHVTPLGSAGIHDIAEALVTMSHAKGLESVEFTQSNTYKINFSTNRGQNQPSTSRSSIIRNVRDPGHVHVQDDGCGYAPMPSPPPNTFKPSAPLIPTNENPVYGYPVDQLYDFPRSSKYDDPHGCCTIL